MGNGMLFSVRLPASVKEEGGVFISHTPALDLYSQGDTLEEAKENLKEAVIMFLDSCYRRGAIDEVLKECGFDPYQKITEEQSADWLDVPLSLLASKGNYGTSSATAH